MTEFKAIKVNDNNGFKTVIIPDVHFSTGAYKPFNGQDSKVKRLTVYINIPDEETQKELASLGFTIYDNSKNVKPGEAVEHWIITKFSTRTTLYNLSEMVKQTVEFTPEHVNFEVDKADVAIIMTQDTATKQPIVRLSAYKYYPAKVSMFTSDLFGDDKDFSEIITSDNIKITDPAQKQLF